MTDILKLIELAKAAEELLPKIKRYHDRQCTSDHLWPTETENLIIILEAIPQLATARNDALEMRNVLRPLVEKLDKMQDNESLKTVFAMAHVHGFSYTGPNYQTELNAARAALKTPAPVPPAKEWKLIGTAPKDGREIEVVHDSDFENTSTAFWSDNPICMLGSRAGSHPPGWATGSNSGTDFNLPIDPPSHWRPTPPAKEEK